MSGDASEPRWIDVEVAARILGVSGRSIRRACERGTVTRWRRVGFGILKRRRYQVTVEEISAVFESRAFHGQHMDRTDNTDT